MNSNNNIIEEIQRRIKMANRARSRNIIKRSKITKSKTLLRQLLKYGPKTLILTEKDEKALCTIKHEILRKIF